MSKKPELGWLPVTSLVIETEYQRELHKDARVRINKIVAKFDWRLFGSLTVARLNKVYAVIDGQHRLAAARQAGLEEVPCTIIVANSIQERARLFVQLNRDRAAVRPIQQFWAEVAAGNEDAVAMRDLCASCGITIARYQHGRHPPLTTSALGSIRAAMHHHGEAAARRALTLMARAKPKTDGVFGMAAITGTVAFVARMKTDLDVNRFKSALEKLDFDKALLKARTIKHERLLNNIGEAFALVVKEAYIAEAKTRAMAE